MLLILFSFLFLLSTTLTPMTTTQTLLTSFQLHFVNNPLLRVKSVSCSIGLDHFVLAFHFTTTFQFSIGGGRVAIFDSRAPE